MANTPNLDLRKPDWKAARWDIELNQNFDILDGKIQDLTAINKIIASSVNLVDVFIYDTSQDSDGGTWRDRCQNLSWYNEELNTPTRGKTRKFPAIALVLAETNKVTIYDLTDSTVALWRVHDFVGYVVKSVVMSSTNLGVAMTAGLHIYNYMAAKEFLYTTISLPAIINNSCNDVTMIVLPDALDNPSTQLQVPTIVVATEGGISVINGPAGIDTVVSIVNSNGDIDVNITETTLYVGTRNYDTISVGPYPLVDALNSAWREYYYSGNPAFVPVLFLLGGNQIHRQAGSFPVAGGCAVGLTLLSEDQAAPLNGMVAYITSAYFSGWLQGDIELSLSGESLVDKSHKTITVTDNGNAIFESVANDSDLQKTTAIGGTITAAIPTGQVCYGWEEVAGEWIFRSEISAFVGISESSGILTIVDGTVFTLIRYTSGVPTTEQLQFIEDQEKELFESDAKYLLPSDNVQTLSFDNNNNILTVGTDFGAVKYKGLRKLSDSLLLDGQTSLDIKAVSSSGGVDGIVTTAESGVIIPEINLREEINGINKSDPFKRNQDDLDFGDTENGDYLHISEKGTLSLKGSATVWDDLVGSLIGKKLALTTGKVDYDWDENAIVFQPDGNITNSADRLVFNFQYPHSAIVDGKAYLHMHWEQVDSVAKEMTIKHRVQSNGVSKNSTWVTTVVALNAASNVFSYVSGTLNQITALIIVDMAGVSISSTMQFQITRTDSTAGDILATFIDAHVELDTLGSESEYVK